MDVMHGLDDCLFIFAPQTIDGFMKKNEQKKKSLCRFWEEREKELVKL